MIDCLSSSDLDKVARKYLAATKLLDVATEDYAAARCLSCNLLPAALVSGAQAMEKYLKALILLCDPGRDVRHLSHALPRLIAEANQLTPSLSLLRWKSLAQNFQTYCATRYPDNPWPESGIHIGMTTPDMLSLDEFVVFLNENLPCPKSLKYRTGFYQAVTFSLGYGASVTPTEHWLKANNHALSPILSRIQREYREVISVLES